MGTTGFLVLLKMCLVSVFLMLFYSLLHVCLFMRMVLPLFGSLQRSLSTWDISWKSEKHLPKVCPFSVALPHNDSVNCQCTELTLAIDAARLGAYSSGYT